MAGLTKEQRAAKEALKTQEIASEQPGDMFPEPVRKPVVGGTTPLAKSPDVKHVQFHAGVDAMGSSLSVTNKQADIYLDVAGVRIHGKTDKNKGKKFFIPFTNIRGVTLL